MFSSQNNLFFSLIPLVSSHMEMVEPIPRHSKFLKGLRSELIDYSMTAPLGAGRPYPCIGYERGPNSGTYSAGDQINTKLSGGANHNGGHCQFSLSYDGKTFVALKTVLGNCMIDSLSYSVKIPGNAPSGPAVYAWTWINRTGNREFYMNCADIEINGKQGGSVEGNEMLVGNFDVPGKKTYVFPEGFSKDFGKEYFEETPVLAISPQYSGSSQGSDAYETIQSFKPKGFENNKPKKIKNNKPKGFKNNKPKYSKRPTHKKRKSKNKAIKPKPVSTETLGISNVPNYTYNIPSYSNDADQMKCQDDTHFTIRSENQDVLFSCPPGTQCRPYQGTIICK